MHDISIKHNNIFKYLNLMPKSISKHAHSYILIKGTFQYLNNFIYIPWIFRILNLIKPKQIVSTFVFILHFSVISPDTFCPMIESIRYTRELPDADYINYVVSREECKDFKHMARDFSVYNSLDHLLFKDGEVPTKEKYIKVKDNWSYLKKINVAKAHCMGHIKKRILRVGRKRPQTY